ELAAREDRLVVLEEAALHQHRREVGARGVDRGRVTGRAAAHDQDLDLLHHLAGVAHEARAVTTLRRGGGLLIVPACIARCLRCFPLRPSLWPRSPPRRGPRWAWAWAPGSRCPRTRRSTSIPRSAGGSTRTSRCSRASRSRRRRCSTS